MDPMIFVAMLIMFFAASVQGVSGFGRAMVASPLIAIILPADETVIVMILMGVISGSVMVYKTHKYSDIKKVLPMIFFGVAGIIIGIQILKVIPVNELKIVMGALVIISAIILATGVRLKIKNEKLAYGVAGFVGGIMNGAVSFGGPPTVLFLQNQNEKKNSFRANLSLFFLIVGIAGSVNLFAQGMLSGNILLYAALLTPVCVGGTYFGNHISHKFNEKTFKKAVLAILFAAGILAIIFSVL